MNSDPAANYDRKNESGGGILGGAPGASPESKAP